MAALPRQSRFRCHINGRFSTATNNSVLKLPIHFVIFITYNRMPVRDDHKMNFDRTFFVTTVTAARLPIFRNGAAANLFIDTLAHYRDEGKYLLHEFVVMPDHVHLLLTPCNEISLERAVQFIKGGFSFCLKRGHVWQQGFTNHRIRDFQDFEEHREYIRMNPVRARLASSAGPYPYSSAADVLPLDLIPQGLKPHSDEGALTPVLKARSSTSIVLSS